jgi:hypothetical protein
MRNAKLYLCERHGYQRNITFPTAVCEAVVSQNIKGDVTLKANLEEIICLFDLVSIPGLAYF